MLTGQVGGLSIHSEVHMLGLPELLVVLMLALTGIVPLAIGIWAVVTLHRVRATQDAMKATLDRLEQRLAGR
jgi:hypothetical protein